MKPTLEEFDGIHKAQEGSLPFRVLHHIEKRDEVLSAADIACRIAEARGRYAAMFDPKVKQLLPEVEEILTVLALHKRIRHIEVQDALLGTQHFYSRLQNS